MKKIVVLAFATLLFVSFASAREQPSDDELIQAFLNCPEIIDAQNQLGASATAGTPEILFYNSMCGVAGCQYTALIARKYERKSADPMTMHILGLVHVGTKGVITKVERVELVPYGELVKSEERE